MSNYAQIITSFERTGDFPIEANFIFPTIDALKEFYSDEIQAATMHKGLVKVVEDNGYGQQSLYWVTPNTETGELEFTELISTGDTYSLAEAVKQLTSDLEEEILNRKKADAAIWGTTNQSIINTDYNSILKIAEVLEGLKEFTEQYYQDMDDLKILESERYDSIIDKLHHIVGTEEADINAYLETLPYTSITEIANALKETSENAETALANEGQYWIDV